MSARAVVFATQAPFIGGAELSLLRSATALDPVRYRASVIAGHDSDYLGALRASGLEHRHIPLPIPDRRRPWKMAVAVARVAGYLHRQRAALVHVNDATAHPIPAVAARLLRIPRLCHLHFSYPAAGLRWYLRWGFEHALFPSRFLRQHAQNECPELFPDSRCTVIPNGYDPPSPPPADERLRALRDECLLTAPGPVFGFVGRVVAVKGVDDYLRMAQALLAGDSRCRFLVIGEDHGAGPSHRTAMEKLAHDLGIAPACHFLGFRDDVWDLLHLCDVVVLPSHVESFSYVAVEAGAAGRPLVATRAGGIPEIVRDGETGLLVPPNDPPALATAAAQLIANQPLRERMGAAARAHVRSQFSLRAHAQALADLYDARVPTPSRSVQVQSPTRR
jgi:glycosyltransferase involved in cell wall biosynthesis